MGSEHKVPQPWQGLSPCLCHSWHSATMASQSVPLSSSGQCLQSPAKLMGCWICSSLPGAEVLSCIFLGFLCLYAPPEARRAVSASRVQGWLGFTPSALLHPPGNALGDLA